MFFLFEELNTLGGNWSDKHRSFNTHYAIVFDISCFISYVIKCNKQTVAEVGEAQLQSGLEGGI